MIHLQTKILHLRTMTWKYGQLGDFDLMIRIHWIGKSPVPLENTDDGTCWVFKSRCMVVSKAKEPGYENLLFGGPMTKE